ncbi:MAG: CpXC domain-containing protein [Chloroflexi bacterium]|nr:CpXC domain-containing protein [Chloroflexota bacterium]
MQQGSAIRCSNCGQPFNARVHSYIDVQKDPQAKGLLVNQQINRFPCPHCGNVNVVLAPLLYHDATKELLITCVPMELNFSKDQQERVIGDLMKQLPKEGFRSYMFNPKRALTMNGLIEMVLGADGITPEMIDQAKKRTARVQKFVEASDAELDSLIAAHDAEIDMTFIQTFTSLAQRLAQGGRPDMAQAVLATQAVVVQKSSYGKELQQQQADQEAVVQEVADQLQALGADSQREDLAALALSYADDEMRLQALVGLARPALDAPFFELLNQMEGSAAEADKPKFALLNERLPQYIMAIDQQAQMRVSAAVAVLQALLEEQDIDAAIARNAHAIDETLIAVLNANLQEAQRRRDVQMSAKLKAIYERVVALIQQSMPEEVVLVDKLLQAPTIEDARVMVMDGMAQYGETLIDVMASIAEQLDDEGRGDLSERLYTLIAEAQSALGPNA